MSLDVRSIEVVLKIRGNAPIRITRKVLPLYPLSKEAGARVLSRAADSIHADVMREGREALMEENQEEMF